MAWLLHLDCRYCRAVAFGCHLLAWLAIIPALPLGCAGCIAAIEAQHFLQSNQDGAETSFIGQGDLNAAWVAKLQQESQLQHEAQERQASADKVGWT